MRSPKEIRDYLLELEKSLTGCLTGKTPIDVNLHYMRMGSLKTVEDLLNFIDLEDNKNGNT